MASITFTLPGRLPGMNEIIDTARTHWSSNAKLKKTWTNAFAQVIGPYWPTAMSPPVLVSFEWYEPNDKRDPDNIMAGQKFILDALVKKHVLRNDDRENIKTITHRFHTDAICPRVEVTIAEV